MRITAAFIVVGMATHLASAEQAPRRPAEEAAVEAPYTATTMAILVDVVVRDRRDKPVLDLKATDFEVLEDNVPQTVGSFSVVERTGGIGIRVKRTAPGTTTIVEGAGEAPAAPEPRADLKADAPTTAIVFDSLSPDALQLAQRAALAYLPMSEEEGGASIAVFSSEPGLRVLQPYTTDASLVRQAVRSVTPAGTTKQELESERRQALNQRLVVLDSLGIGRDNLSFGPDSANSVVTGAIVEQQMTSLEMRMLRTFETLDRDHRGFGTATALLAVVQSLRVLPGRKTLVYFSEGLPASPSMQARLDTVVSAANRANVSVYTVDAAGLRTESSLLETRREIDAAGQERLRQTAVSRDPTQGPLTRVVERTEDLIRLDPQGGLARLAEDTGGFLIRDTNDLTSAFRRIDEDNRFHYLLTYSPANTNFDGKFRRIDVKVRREGTQVFARKGYLAVRTSTLPVLSYEAPAIALLDRGTPPNAFPMSASAFVFPNVAPDATVPIVVQLRTSALQFEVDPVRQTYSAQAAIVARLRNAEGEVIRTLSQQYILTGQPDELDAAKSGEILFYRQPELPPGVYTLEAIVHDAVADRASARLSTITIPAPRRGEVQASSLVLVRRAEKVEADDQAPDMPLYYGDTLLYPNAGEPLQSGVDSELLFYFAFYAPAPGAEVSATLEIMKDGRTLASRPVDLPKPSGAERVQHVGKLPLNGFPAGAYELKVRLHAGGAEQIRSTFFTITE